ncbi:MAG: hypothetical protein COA36_02735 [Desulfotalea sp.]|nr:MAG: hypothetical protein COA36_02735 [Desulfotalea sp.]
MKKGVCIIALLVAFMAHVHGARAEEGSLTLMKNPQSMAQNSGQQTPQMAQMPQGQGQALDLYDIYGVVPTKGRLPYLYILLAVLVVLVVAALVFWFFKRRGRRCVAPVIPPWERALADLEDAKTYQSNGQGRLYMDRAGQILRYYIEQRFAIKTTRKTTGEFLCSLRDSSDTKLGLYRGELQSCLEQADMAKFAHQIPDEQNLLVMEQAVVTFVNSTRPSPGDMEGEQ